jgi:signal transduction histidine kinase
MPLKEHPSAARGLLELTRTTGEKDWGTSIRNIVQFDAESLPVERVSFWSYSAESSSMRCESGYVATGRIFERGAMLYQADQPGYFDEIRQARLFEVENVDTDPRTRALREYLAVRGIVSLLDVPVWVEGRLAGVLCHEHVGAARHWTTDDEEFAIGVGQVVASALMARARTQADEAAFRAAFLDDVSRTVGGSLETTEVAERAVDVVVHKLADGAIIWALSHDGAYECLARGSSSAHARAAVEGLVAAVASGSEPPFIAAKVVSEEQSLLLPTFSLANLGRLNPTKAQLALVKAARVQTALGVPLAVAGKPFGAMVLVASRRQYSGWHLALAEDIAMRVAAALVNARHFAAAREAIKARDDFLVLASHELRTPLASLQLHSQNLHRQLERRGDESAAAQADAIGRQVARMARLLEHMNEALKVRADGISLGKETCDLVAIVESSVKQVAALARPASKITLEAHGTLVGHWDRRRLEQVVLALLENAIKFGEGKPIEVELHKDGDDAVLRVRDHGLGIAADRLSAIFSPFERAVHMEHFGGLGLGLYIAKATAEAHDGSIAVKSRVGEGATFEVRLPLSQPEEEQRPGAAPHLTGWRPRS